MTVAERCIALDGGVAFEWPRSCAYWHDRSVKSVIRRHNLTEVHFDGCMYGLASSMPKTSGKLIRKPWTIATSMRELNLLCRKCDHKPSEHAPCAGMDTKATEGYTDKLVINLHAAIEQWCDAQRAR